MSTRVDRITARHHTNFAYQFRSALSRQSKLVGRNPALIGPRIGQATFLGFLVGGLFYGLGTDSFSSIARVGLILSTLSVTPWANLNELPANDEAKPVVHKQLDAGFYSPAAYVLAQTLLNLPLLVIESLILTIIIYWMGFFTADAGRFFFFFWCLFLNDAFFSIAFRTISYAAPNQFIAQQAGAPIVSGLISFAGFLITYRNIPDWLWEFYWISPFAWLARAMAISEFSAARFDTIVTAQNSSTGQPGRIGDIALQYWQMPGESFYQWLAFAPLIFYYIVGVFAVTYIVSTKRFEVQLGTKRPKQGSAEDLQLQQSSVRINIQRQDSESASASSVLPFVPIELVWKNIFYTVPIKDASDKTLLTDISAFCRPGECTALMGSSGAGKTTLMDVIAGRKTAGKIQGDILLNGQPKDDKVFQRITGYVEQNDLHMPLSTVREALLFSAKLRLPASVPDKKRVAFVDELLHLLELDAIQHRIIGNAEINGLSPAQTKLVTIGVELAANPSILFLDEPTSGIDSRAALVVMRVVRKIAATGRTVLCTIHQPSSELFFMFDRLVLLRTGGTMVYNGTVGHEGKDIVNYFESAAGKNAEKRENELQNPASWMLEVLMRARDNHVDYTEIWSKNKLASDAQRELDELASKQSGTSIADRDTSRLNAFSEMMVVLGRQFKSYWRNTAYNLVRTVICTALGIIYGLLYLNVASDIRNDHNFQTPTKLNSILGGLLMVIAFMSALNCATALPVISGERAVYYREQASKTYHSLSYALALWIVEIPFTALPLIGFTVPFYYLAGFLSDSIEFLKFFFMIVLVCWTINSMGHWLAAFSPNLIIASQLQGLLFTFVFQFGGVFIREEGPGAIAPGFNWIYYMNPVPKALNSIAMAQFGIVGATDSPYPSGCQNTGTCEQGYVTGVTGEQVTISYYLSNEYLGASPGSTYWSQQVGWIILTWIVFRIFSILSLRFISYLKR